MPTFFLCGFFVISLLSVAFAYTLQTNQLSTSNYAVLTTDNNLYFWGQFITYWSGGTVSLPIPNVQLVASNAEAIAIVDMSGSVLCYGDSSYGGNCDHLSSVTGIVALYSTGQLFSSGGAFAALDSTGKVYAWGSAVFGGTIDPYNLVLLKSDVVSIYSCGIGFAAMRSDGTIVPWSSDSTIYAGVVSDLIAGRIKRVYGTRKAFCVLKESGVVYCWGDSNYGGTAAAGLTNIVDISTTDCAFAALSSDGTVTAWGCVANGGSVVSFSGVAAVYSNYYAFAALMVSGTITAWGNAAYGGSTATNAFGKTISSIITVYGGFDSFAALRSDGVLVSWGNLIEAAPATTGNVIQVVSNTYGWSALDSTGAVYIWGSANAKTVTSAASSILALQTVIRLFSNAFSFGAIYGAYDSVTSLRLGTPTYIHRVVCWGGSNLAYGGDCTSYTNAPYMDQMIDIKTAYGQQWSVTQDYQTPTTAPTSFPSVVPSSSVPSSKPIKPTAVPSTFAPTPNPQGYNLFPTAKPSASPTSLPSSGLTAPVLSGSVANMSYYCRPRTFAYAKNGNKSLNQF